MERLQYEEEIRLVREWQELHHNYKNLESRLDFMDSELIRFREQAKQLTFDLNGHVENCGRVEQRLTSLHADFHTSWTETVRLEGRVCEPAGWEVK